MPRKTAIVTGAGSGLGSGIARALAGAGYDLALHTGTNPDRARALARELEGTCGVRAEVFQADFSKPDGAQALFAQFRQTFDRLDLFVNNAGITQGGPILGMTGEVFDLVNSINWRSAYFCVQQAGALMKAGGGGSMVLISSNNHAMNWYGASVYGCVKEALVKLTRHAAMEFAQYGIRVNCIAPGWVDTGEARMGGGQKERSIPNIPLKRWVQPGEIGQWILFLSGPAASSLTGDTIELDGGVRIMSGPAGDYGL